MTYAWPCYGLCAPLSPFADACAVVTVVSADAPLTFVAAVDSFDLATFAGRQGVASEPAAAPLPSSVSLSPVSDAACGCLNSGALELDIEVRRWHACVYACVSGACQSAVVVTNGIVWCGRAQVPETSVKVESVRLLDATGELVLEVYVPPEQQTRFSSDTAGNPRRLHNRVWVDLLQYSAPAGDLSAVTHVSVRRTGLAGLDNLEPSVRDTLQWRVISMHLRRGCKGTSVRGAGEARRAAPRLVLVPLTAMSRCAVPAQSAARRVAAHVASGRWCRWCHHPKLPRSWWQAAL